MRDDQAPVRFAALSPRGERLDVDEVAGVDFGALAPAGRPYVVLNMVASADGKATLGGRTKGMGNAADRALFHRLRTRVDAVMVGAGTLRAERYGRLVPDAVLRRRRSEYGLEPDPLAVVASTRLALTADVPMLAVPEQRIVAITESEAEIEGGAAPVDYLRGLGLPAALGRLRADYGVRSLLCEGGPTLNAELLRAGLVDELFLCFAPMLLGGSGLTIVAGEPFERPVPLEPVWLLESGGQLFLRLRVQR